MKKLLICTFLIAWMLPVRADGIRTPLPKKCEAFRPDILFTSTSTLTEKNVKALLRSGDYGQNSSRRGSDGQEYWIVYSDRANNPTYVEPGSKTVFKQLGFNDKVRIAQIKDGWALVYTEPKEQETYPRFSSMIEWQGWIPMDHLLLWSVCPTNDKGIYNKAVFCVNLDENTSNGRTGKCFKNPDNMDDYSRTRTDFTYFFVMKEQGDLFLLAHQNTLDGPSYKVLYGWVDKSSFVAWNQRSCLEPNWNPDDVEYFAKNGVKVYIYDDAAMTNKASFITFPTPSGSYKADMYRMAGDVLRYPILDNSTETAWNCSTFSSPGNGAINAGTTRRDASGNPYKRNLEALSNINISIVIDGTRSMERYFPAVKQTIQEIGKFFPDTWHVKVGVLIYRDKYDGKYITEMVNFTNPKNVKLAAWLDNGGEYGIRSSAGDKTMEEALFYGIDAALEGFNFNPEESNLMFVIGDCGDAGDYPEITEESLIAKLAAKNVSLMGFQVRNEASSTAFSFFNNNIISLIQGSLSLKYNNLIQTYGNEDQKKSRVEIMSRLRKIQNKDKKSFASEYIFDNNVQNAEGDLFIGSHKYVQAGAMDVNELREQIESVVAAVKKNVDYQANIFTDAYNGVVEKKADIYFESTSGVITGTELEDIFLKRRVSAEAYNTLKANGLAVSFKGYTPKTDASQHDYYKSVIFISQQELSTMMLRLKPLYEVADREGNDREPYVKAMKALLQGMIPNISDSEMNAKGYDEVMSMVAGLNVATRMFKGRTIAEVASTKAVPANEYLSILKKFKQKYKKLQLIQKQPYPFVREYNGAKYYWIPTDDLP